MWQKFFTYFFVTFLSHINWFITFIISESTENTAFFFWRLKHRKKRENIDISTFLVFSLEATPGFEPGIRVLQTRALPLGYVAICIWSERRDSNPRHQPWQGCTLPTELLSHKLLIIIANLSRKVNILPLKIDKNNLWSLSFLIVFTFS